MAHVPPARAQIAAAGRVEQPRPLVELGAVLSDAPRDRIREHRVGIAVELADQPLEPARMPAIVIAHPREVLGRRALAHRDLHDVAPGGDHRLPDCRA